MEGIIIIINSKITKKISLTSDTISFTIVGPFYVVWAVASNIIRLSVFLHGEWEVHESLHGTYFRLTNVLSIKKKKLSKVPKISNISLNF
jgi:hypothetical protein